jgi:hypothetical protein
MILRRLVHFHGDAMRLGPGILPNAGDLPGNFHVRFVRPDGERVLVDGSLGETSTDIWTGARSWQCMLISNKSSGRWARPGGNRKEIQPWQSPASQRLRTSASTVGGAS